MASREPKRWSVGNVLSLAGLCALALAVTGTVVAATARATYVGELATNLRAYIGLGALVAGLLCVAGRARWFALPALALVVFHGWPIFALYAPLERADESGLELVVATVNVNYTNLDTRPFEQWLADTDADVVAVLEVTPVFREALARFEHEYPHQVFPTPPNFKFTLALLSRHPVVEARSIRVEEAERTYLEVELDVHGERIHTVVLHPMRPGNGWGTSERNLLLTRVARETDWRPTSLVLGDLNATGYSPIFDDFLRSSGLRDSRRGFGWQPSWCSVKHLSGIWLAIDHVLVGSGVRVLERSIGPDLGSDHRPVRAKLSIARDSDSQPTP